MKVSDRSFFLLLSIGFFLSASFSLEAQDNPNGYKLEQVFVMGRHNVRSPLIPSEIMDKISRKKLPAWGIPGGELSLKGGLLEVYMGNYLRYWLKQQGLFESDSCPNPSQIHVYANSLQRTVATANYFVTGAFPTCNIPVHHKNKIGHFDSIFRSKLRSRTGKEKQEIESEMRKATKELKLEDTYALLETILDYKNSPECIMNDNCSFTSKENEFIIENGKEPSINGPFLLGLRLADAFNMQFYEGFKKENVAWGMINERSEFKLILNLINSYQDIKFTTSDIAEDFARPLLHYMNRHFKKAESSKENPVFSLVMGHDSNIATLLSALKFKEYNLPDQYEKTPIGGQVIFQRWHDPQKNRDLLKVEYVYQTTDQIRDGIPLTEENPPGRVVLRLDNVTYDSQGFCDWEDFKEIIAKTLR